MESDAARRPSHLPTELVVIEGRCCDVAEDDGDNDQADRESEEDDTGEEDGWSLQSAAKSKEKPDDGAAGVRIYKDARTRPIGGV